MRSIYGERGESWLRNLPSTLRQLEQSWNISLLPPFANLSYHYVAPGVTHSGRAIVVKIGVDFASLAQERLALEAFQGRACVEILGVDENRGALLLEGLKPGTPLCDFRDDISACEIAAKLMPKMHRPPASVRTFPTVEDWFQALRTTRLPEVSTDGASELLSRLLQSQERSLLHGDLHDQNILGCASQWIAIDPKGVVGPRGFEIGPFLRNRVRHKNQARHLAGIFAQGLHLKLSDVLDWTYCDCILSACWSFQEKDPHWEETIRKAQWFKSEGP